MLKHLDSLDGRTLFIAGNPYHYFSGTSYLSIAFHPQFQQYLTEGMSLYGSNYGGSRLSNLQFSVYEATEDYLAEFTASEAALTLSSGTLAGQLLSLYLAQTHQLIYAPKTHPALGHSKAIPVVQENWINQAIEQAHIIDQPLAIFSNSIDPLYATPTDFSWWKELPKNRKTIVVLDDSHGFGVLGKKGAGIRSILEVPEQVELIISTSLAKASAIPGGAILANKRHIDALRNNPLFGGASPIVPAYLHAFLKAKQFYQDQLKKLRQNIELFTSSIDDLSDFRYLPEFPVFYTPNQLLPKQLHSKRILISSFPYPTKASPCINRIVLNAAHEADDIIYLSRCLKEIQE